MNISEQFLWFYVAVILVFVGVIIYRVGYYTGAIRTLERMKTELQDHHRHYDHDQNASTQKSDLH
jgi:hypothetical protein